MNTTTDNAQGLRDLRAHIDSTRKGLPDDWQDWASEIVADIGNLIATHPPQQERAASGVLVPLADLHALLAGSCEACDEFDHAQNRAYDAAHERLSAIVAAAPAAPRSGHEAALPATPESERSERKERSDESAEPVAWRARSYSWPTWAYGDTESSACDRACRNNEEVVADVQALYTHPTPAASESSPAPSAAPLGGLREAVTKLADDMLADSADAELTQGFRHASNVNEAKLRAILATPQASTPAAEGSRTGKASSAQSPEQDQALRFLARDIHYAICDHGLAPLLPSDNNGLRETILQVLRAAQQEKPTASTSKGGGQ